MGSPSPAGRKAPSISLKFPGNRESRRGKRRSPGPTRKRKPNGYAAGLPFVLSLIHIYRKYGETRQALYSYKLRFAFPTDAGMLNYLRGRCV